MAVWAVACICWVSLCGGLLLGGAGFWLGMRGVSEFENEIAKKRQKNTAHFSNERKKEEGQINSNQEKET